LGWRHALLALASINLLVCVPIHAFLPRDEPARILVEEPDAGDDLIAQAAVRRALREPVFWALMLCFTAYYATFAAMTFHLIPLLIERGFSTGVVVAAMAFVGPAQVAARVVLLALGPRMSTAVTGHVVFLAFPLSILILIVFPASTVALFVAIFIYGGANGMTTIIRGTAVADLLWKEGYGAINGLIAFPSNVAKAAGPIGAALVWSLSGNYGAVLWVVLFVALVTAGSFWFATEHSRFGTHPRLEQ
jgi:predicted MFS family arabinose efflux permease